ncbi:MAG: hypothetical protein HRF45_11780 [Fimbriimonadia bacterium]|jgi:hypothetical protein
MSRRRRIIVLCLGLVALAMGVGYPLLFPAPAADLPTREKAMVLLYGLTYLLALILVLGAMALVAAREIRDVLDQYREERKSAIRSLIHSLVRPRRRDGSNGHPLE